LFRKLARYVSRENLPLTEKPRRKSSNGREEKTKIFQWQRRKDENLTMAEKKRRTEILMRLPEQYLEQQVFSKKQAERFYLFFSLLMLPKNFKTVYYTVNKV
jgi:hypothetical protein